MQTQQITNKMLDNSTTSGQSSAVFDMRAYASAFVQVFGTGSAQLEGSADGEHWANVGSSMNAGTCATISFVPYLRVTRNAATTGLTVLLYPGEFVSR